MTQNHLNEIVIDCRMIQSSGIGVVLRQLIRTWAENPPGFRLRLLGNPKVLSRELPPEIDAEYLNFDVPVYGPKNIFAAPPLKNIPLFFSPHYSVPYRLLSQPAVVMVQDVIHITHPTHPLSSAYMKLCLQYLKKKAKFIITPSRHTKVQLQTLHGFPAHRVLTHHLGPGLVQKKDNNHSRFDSEKPYFLSVGIDKPHKNYDFLINQYQKYSEENVSVPKLLIAGLNEKGRIRLQRSIVAKGMDQQISILEFIPDAEMPGLYQNAKALIVSSLEEGFGLPLTEAMVQGVPVVLPDLPPMNEIVGDCGVYYDPDLSFSFHDALSRLDQLPSDIKGKLKDQAQQYSWQQFADQLADTFHRAVEEGNSP